MGREPRDTYRGSDWFSRLVNITIRAVSTEKILNLLCFALGKDASSDLQLRKEWRRYSQSLHRNYVRFIFYRAYDKEDENSKYYREHKRNSDLEREKGTNKSLTTFSIFVTK